MTRSVHIAGLLCCAAAVYAQRAPGAVLLDTRPIYQESQRLEKAFHTVVTFEDPVWRWKGEGIGDGGSQLNALYRFTRPTEPERDIESSLERVLNAYHAQTQGPRFRVVTSRLGLHIVPEQARDEYGRMVAAVNPLDALIRVAFEARTAREHMAEIIRQVTAASGVEIHFGAGVASRQKEAVSWLFASDPERFGWGVTQRVAREALIDLLDRSATSFGWDLICSPGVPECWFDLRVLPAAPGKFGFERCGECTYARSRPGPAPEIMVIEGIDRTDELFAKPPR